MSEKEAKKKPKKIFEWSYEIEDYDEPFHFKVSKNHIATFLREGKRPDVAMNNLVMSSSTQPTRLLALEDDDFGLNIFLANQLVGELRLDRHVKKL